SADKSVLDSGASHNVSSRLLECRVSSLRTDPGVERLHPTARRLLSWHHRFVRHADASADRLAWRSSEQATPHGFLHGACQHCNLLLVPRKGPMAIVDC